MGAGLECGIGMDDYDDWIEGDTIEAFNAVQKRRTLEEASASMSAAIEEAGVWAVNLVIKESSSKHGAALSHTTVWLVHCLHDLMFVYGKCFYIQSINVGPKKNKSKMWQCFVEKENQKGNYLFKYLYKILPFNSSFVL